MLPLLALYTVLFERACCLRARVCAGVRELEFHLRAVQLGKNFVARAVGPVIRWVYALCDGISKLELFTAVVVLAV